MNARFFPCLVVAAMLAVPATADEGKVTLKLVSASAEHVAGTICVLVCQVEVENNTGAELRVKSQFYSALDGLDLVIMDQQGKKLRQQPFIYHQSPMAEERTYPVPIGTSKHRLAFDLRDLPMAAEKLQVQIAGTLPGSGYEPVLITNVVPVKVAAPPNRPADEQAKEAQPRKPKTGIALPFEAWEFQETDGHLWLMFRRVAEKDNLLDRFPIELSVSLAGVRTKFVPLAYFKGNDDERKKQQEVNDAIAAFITEQLKGKTVWIEDAKPAIFAGPNQAMGIVWFDPDRKRSLQQLLLEKGLAVKFDQPWMFKSPLTDK